MVIHPYSRTAGDVREYRSKIRIKKGVPMVQMAQAFLDSTTS